MLANLKEGPRNIFFALIEVFLSPHYENMPLLGPFNMEKKVFNELFFYPNALRGYLRHTFMDKCTLFFYLRHTFRDKITYYVTMSLKVCRK